MPEPAKPRRVKVYLLRGDDWIDNGTGYCVGEFSKDSKPYFLVRSENDEEEIILKSFLEGSIQYQRQQETLIVWTDLEGKDLALSFQETEACADLCEFIIKAQQEKYAPEISLYYVIPNNSVIDNEYNSNNGSTQPSEVTELITGPINLPPQPPTEQNLTEVLEAISQGSNSQYTRGSISKFMKDEEYLIQLIEAFQVAETNENLAALHLICESVKTLILYNEASIIEEFLSDDIKVYGLVGILEYDREYPNFKACYRESLRDKSKFKVVIDLPNDEALKIFKNDFHLNFLKDVVLARFLDDQTFNLISSLIYFNQVDIINFLKDPEGSGGFLENLFQLYEDAGDLEKRKDGVRMLHQYILIAKSLQSFQKSEFFSTLVKRGLFKMVSFAVRDSESEIRILGTEIIVVIIEQDVSLVNSIDNDVDIDNSDPPPPKQGDEDAKNSNGGEGDDTVIESKSLHLRLSDDMTLMQILTKLLIEDENPGLKMQAFEALRILLDSNIASNSMSPSGASNDNEIESLKNEFNSINGISSRFDGNDDFNDINTSNYFQAFYSQVAPELFGKLIDLNDILTCSESLLLQHLLELVSFCTKEHEVYISQPFFLETHILSSIGRIISQQTFKTTLKLTAIRCFKNILLLNDSKYTKYILENNILGQFFSYFKGISNENNLANSSCLDLLEIFIRSCDCDDERSNFKVLAREICEREREFLTNGIDFVNTGKELLELMESSDKDDEVMIEEELSHDASTPIHNEESSEYIISEGSTNVNMFESIESELRGKRQYEEDENDAKNGKDIEQDQEATKGEEEEEVNEEVNKKSNGHAKFHAGSLSSPKKLSKTIKHKLNTTSKKIASIRQNQQE
ncbi:serine/threonine-protein phosphatase 4 regulatory subunit 3 [[Candida] anglica]